MKAQVWLDKNYPKDSREWESELNISNKKLEGDLNLEEFVNLEILNCEENMLTSLELSNCEQLREIDCSFNNLINLDLSGLEQLEVILCNNNYLTTFDYLSLNPNKLTSLNISDNNLPEQDLSVFSSFVNLQELSIGCIDERKVKQGIYNRFVGSLEHLKDLVQLEELCIDNTDINEGMKYLPLNLKEISCSLKAKKDSKVKLLITERLSQSNAFVFDTFNKVYLGRKVSNETNAIENFDHKNLTREQKELLKKIIPNNKQRGWYEKNGLCGDCRQLNNNNNWCQTCKFLDLRESEKKTNNKNFQQESENWLIEFEVPAKGND